MTTKEFTAKCPQCGQDLEFQPATQKLFCRACHSTVDLALATTPIIEEDYEAALVKIESNVAKEIFDSPLLHCDHCGADMACPEHLAGAACPFCATNYVRTQPQSRRQIHPSGILPMMIEKSEAKQLFQRWTRKLWFAPSALKRLANLDQLTGVYLPYWTFDAKTETEYVGERGEIYYETQSYTENGKTKTRRVQRIRWYSASGRVHNDFDDVLAPGSPTLPEDLARKLEPWPLPSLKTYDPAHLLGSQTELYRHDLRTGFAKACEVMREQVTSSIKRHIGGDAQRILSFNTHYENVRFKLILLPIYTASFQWQESTYLILVNACTGEVQGHYPKSAWKISIAILFAGLTVWGLLLGYEWLAYGEVHWGSEGLSDLLSLLLVVAESGGHVDF